MFVCGHRWDNPTGIVSDFCMFLNDRKELFCKKQKFLEYHLFQFDQKWRQKRSKAATEWATRSGPLPFSPIYAYEHFLYQVKVFI